MDLERENRNALSGMIVTAQRLKERIVTLTRELLQQGKRTITFDLACVTSLDGTAIGQFISSYTVIKAAGGEMRMAGATGHLFNVFHVSRLDTVFPFYATAEEAAER
jgi:anti-anti-sigma factor